MQQCSCPPPLQGGARGGSKSVARFEKNGINNYQYSDGSRLQLNFQGEFENQILKLSSSSYSDFAAIAWDAGQETVCFRATKTQDSALITFVETMTLLSENQRVRSTQAFKNSIFDGISFIEEMRLP